jgi:hypothetical protein
MVLAVRTIVSTSDRQEGKEQATMPTAGGLIKGMDGNIQAQCGLNAYD